MEPRQQVSMMRWIAQRQQLVERRSPTRWTACAAVAVVTVLMHLALVGAMLAGEGSPAPSRAAEGLGADAISGETEALSTLIFIEDPGRTAESEDLLERLASQGKALQNIRLTIIAPDVSIDTASEVETADADRPAVSEENTGDRQNRARLFGLYIAQVQARIERAWERPRSPPQGETFECSVQLLQDRRGEVTEVTLLQCDGSLYWQGSLVTAIQRASPLPSPPDPAVFAESLQLTFHAVAFGPTVNVQGYEPAERQVVQSRTPVPEHLPVSTDLPMTWALGGG